MQRARFGWTLIQTLDLRVASMAYLRTIERRTSMSEFLNAWWTYFEDAYGIPEPEDWDQVRDYEQYTSEYRRVSLPQPGFTSQLTESSVYTVLFVGMRSAGVTHHRTAESV